ncbi:PREDICTED: transcription initiation factor TFIID subunit 1-like [Trachymyrmex cornetzi]|uniref:transcription initiation factor TFIID subunit 1-like n=1 Tax=Trachymyrmex cornetzi TaxID=471704 RepID=UPI00084ED45C|nr:PREDICTED: transcription initiation factor TFIID subunit 1-like [Trachymyrmex cornetzi]
MASNEDGDLIDLGNDVCVSRVTVDDATPEEQEHLLDVCPPKLEQKLSLTRQQERVLNSTDNGDILVTLGHDQVVPIRKRIDVVSSDTIKRVRDITRNLEPVIHRTCSGINEETQQDTVDHATKSSCERTREASTLRHEDETYETREINNAFDFLTEHDDNEDQVETSCSDRARNENIDPHRMISPVSLLIGGEEDRVNYPFESSSRISNEEANGRSDVEETKAVTPSEYDAQPDDSVYESPPNSNKFREDNSPKDRSVSIDSESRTRVVLKRRGEENVAFKRGSKRRSFQELHHKSWTEGANLNPAFTNGLPGIDRSTSLKEYRCGPSISNCGTSSFLTRQPPEVESAMKPSEDVCSEGSEVDWSWLEEVEYLRAAESLATAGERERGEQGGRVSAVPTNGSAGRRRASEHRGTAMGRSVAMSVTATAKSLAGGGSRWPPSSGALLLDRQNNNSNNRRNSGRHRQYRNGNNNNNDDDDDEAAAARCNATNEAVDRENRDGLVNQFDSL